MVQGTPTHHTHDAAAGNAVSDVRWRRATGRELGVLLALKLVALALLWWLFFSPAHRTLADAPATGHQLGVEPRAQPETTAHSVEEGATP